MKAHLIFYVSDQPASSRFYARVLDMQPRLDVPGMTEFQLGEGVILGLMPVAGIRRLLGESLPDPTAAAGLPRAELYLLTEDPLSCHERAIANGARELSALAVRDWGHEAAYSLDPDGHVVAFARQIKPSNSAAGSDRPMSISRPGPGGSPSCTPAGGGGQGRSTGPPRLVALATAVPPHVVRQGEARDFARRLFAGAADINSRILQVFENAQIDTRRLCMSIDWFESDHTFAEKNDLYVENAVKLSAEAAGRALLQAGLMPGDVDHVIFVSSTGMATPSIDARIANLLGFRSQVRRTPIWGLGCAGGVVGLSRARDFALADPSARVLLIAVELCSLTFQHADVSKRNLVAASLFGDGAAAAIVLGGEAACAGDREHGTVELLASRSTLWPDSLDVMGWTVDGAGLHVVFSSDIPSIVREKMRPSLLEFLEENGLRIDTLPHIVTHPGGAKVLSAYAETLGLPPSALRHARDVLREFGNMSSPSCLFVLERFLAADEIGPGEHAVAATLGPGFCAEFVLLRGLAR